jgi:hypothetical protein
MVSALEPHAIGERFNPLASPSLMMSSGGETDVKLGFSLYTMSMILNIKKLQNLIHETINQ